MTSQNRTTLKSYFETGDRPTQGQFADLIDSFPLITGDTFTGQVVVPTPTSAGAATNKDYVDTAIASATSNISLSSASITSGTITGVTVDNSVIGATTPARGVFTTISAGSVNSSTVSAAGGYFGLANITVGGGATAAAPVLGLFTNTSQIGNSGGVTDYLMMNTTIPASALSTTSKGFEFETWGENAANANAKTFKLWYAGTTFLTKTFDTGVANKWYIKGNVYRTAANTVLCTVLENRDGASAAPTTYTSVSASDGAANSFQSTVTATGTVDVLQKVMTINFRN